MAQTMGDQGAPQAPVTPLPSHPVSPIANFWLSLFEEADVPGKAVLEWSAPFWDPRQLQKKWLEVLSQTMDGYLRSTAFLEFIHQCSGTSAPGDSARNAVTPRDEIIEGDSHR
jgi:hypothetical protein